ncbi:MAG: ribosome maturation factor RimP [Gammaproteobacteria bacterium]|nr:ribosome maturation factor RimP [Gammaproteobacteria bacterium]
MKQLSQANLASLFEPAVNAVGFELLAVEISGSGTNSVLRVYIDSPEGVTVEGCADVSHQLSGILDVEDPLVGRYTLEVSSPGADRPLVKREHFMEVLGEQVKVRLFQPIEGRRNFKGCLREVLDSSVIVEIDKGEVVLPFADIERARLVPKL